MTTRSIALSVFAVLLALFAGSYVPPAQAAQTPKNDIRLQIEVSQNGAVVAKPELRIADGGTGTMTLKDGTEIRITATSVPHATGASGQ